MTPKEALHTIYKPVDYEVAILDLDLDVSVEDEVYKVLYKAIKEFEELKRYPTTEEVCNELNKYLKNDVDVLYVNGSFYFKCVNYRNEETLTFISLSSNYGKTYYIKYPLPAYLLILLGRFYEGVEKSLSDDLGGK